MVARSEDPRTLGMPEIDLDHHRRHVPLPIEHRPQRVVDGDGLDADVVSTATGVAIRGDPERGETCRGQPMAHRVEHPGGQTIGVARIVEHVAADVVRGLERSRDRYVR